MRISNRKLKKCMKWSNRRKKKASFHLFTNDKFFKDKALSMVDFTKHEATFGRTRDGMSHALKEKLNDNVTVTVIFNNDKSFNRLINTCKYVGSSISSKFENLSKDYQNIVIKLQATLQPVTDAKLIFGGKEIEGIDYSDTNLSCSDFNYLKKCLSHVIDKNISIKIVNTKCE